MKYRQIYANEQKREHHEKGNIVIVYWDMACNEMQCNAIQCEMRWGCGCGCG